MKQHYYFSKYHGLGNDFIIIDAIGQRIDEDLIRAEASLLCSRHTGIGADGIILVLESSECDLKMKIFNKDGTCPEMCGNGLRCFARFAFEQKLIEKELFSVETDAGKMLPGLLLKEGVIQGVEVDMGPPQEDIQRETIDFEGSEVVLYSVSMGNPHAVIFVDSFDDIDLDRIGSFLQTHALFPEGVNVELVQLDSATHIKVVVWERGVGKTLACGTGACAAVVAGITAGKCESNVTVSLPGGALVIQFQSSDQHLIKTGPACHVFDGHVLL